MEQPRCPGLILFFSIWKDVMTYIRLAASFFVILFLLIGGIAQPLTLSAADPPGNPGASQQQAGNPGGDPPGNNGTIKVDNQPFDTHPNNEPHVDCRFDIDFYNYGQGDDIIASYQVDLHAPTNGGEKLRMLEDGTKFIGGDAAGGGTDHDGAVVIDLGPELQDAFDDGILPHPQQGYHVKLTIHAPHSLGADTKYKVFWVEACVQPPPQATTTPTLTATGTPVTEATTTPTPTPTGTPATTTPTPTSMPTMPGNGGTITVNKRMCDSIGQQDTCNGRDTSLDGYNIDFQVFAGSNDQGMLVDTIVVTLGQNANEGGNVGDGSQGMDTGTVLAPGTYTVCEVPVAYKSGFPSYNLDVVPRPEASNGGSTGGQQQQYGDRCIIVTISAGNAVLQFLDIKVSVVATTTPTPTPTPTPVPGSTNTPTPTATGTPVTESMNTPTPTATTPPAPVSTTTPTATPTSLPGVSVQPTNTPTPTATPPGGPGPEAPTNTPTPRPRDRDNDREPTHTPVPPTTPPTSGGRGPQPSGGSQPEATNTPVPTPPSGGSGPPPPAPAGQPVAQAPAPAGPGPQPAAPAMPQVLPVASTPQAPVSQTAPLAGPGPAPRQPVQSVQPAALPRAGAGGADGTLSVLAWLGLMGMAVMLTRRARKR